MFFCIVIIDFKVFRNAADAFIRINVSGVTSVRDLRENNLQEGFPGQIFGENLKMHGSPPVQVIAIPETAQGEFLIRQAFYQGVLIGSFDGAKPIIVFLQHPDLFRFESVDEIGLVGGDKDLGAVFSDIGVSAEFRGKDFQ